MTTTPASDVLDPAVAALHRAMPSLLPLPDPAAPTGTT